MVRVGSTKRNSSREELLRLFQNAGVYHIDGNPVVGSSREDLDLDKISAYFRDVYDLEIKSMDREELDTLLVNSSIAVRVHSKLCAGIAGLLFFGNRQRLGSALETHLPHAGIQFVVYEDDDLGSIIDRFDCYETSPESIDAVIHRIRLNWKTPSVIKGLKREEISFPEGIFRELVVNAVVHRDYSIRGKTRIKMCRGRIDISNPGRLINTVTIDKMKAGISICRNPLILKFMQNYRYADQLGRGIPMVIRKIQKLPGFKFHLQEYDEAFSASVEFPSL
jgi:ATP-dependent DNA helicase RecG